MLRSILIGVVAGQRAMTPLAVVAAAAARNRLPGGPLPAMATHAAVAPAAIALAAAEMAGDKMQTAPDRTVVAGLLARSATAAISGAALAQPGRRRIGGLLAVTAAVATSYAGLALRKRAMRRFGQVRTGFVEDALVLSAGIAIATTGVAEA
jgi:uncharacterized membrane protein